VDHFVAKADVILALGSSLTRSHYILSLPKGKVLLQVTIDEADLGKDYPIALGVIGDARAVLRQMHNVAVEDTATVERLQLRGSAVAREIRTIRTVFLQRWMPLLRAVSTPISPYRVVWELMRAVDPERTIVTHDAGNPRDQLSPFYEAVRPGSYLGWGKTTQLGSGLGFALGAKLARPEAMVVNITGYKPALIIPWNFVGIGGAIVVGMSLIASLWPAAWVARAQPLDLLQAGRAAT